MPTAAADAASAPDASARLRTLVGALRNPSRYPHPATTIEVVETHISYVVLAGDYAYKLKKPVNLGFLDFSTLAARRRYCEEELRLNARTAPQLYLGVLPISGTPDEPQMDGAGLPIEFALRMRRFPQEALLDRMARAGTLAPEHVDALAAEIAAFHARVAAAPVGSDFGTPEQVLSPALANFECIDDPDVAAARSDLETLRAWTRTEHERTRETVVRRRRDGRVREGHGDLHLGNIAWVDGRPVLFDCIEFDPRLRWIDVMNEVAFVVMDLLEHHRPALAWRCLDAYLQRTGDYDGVDLLRWYLVYRAMVRAKVALIRDRHAGVDPTALAAAGRPFRSCIDLAGGLARSWRPALVVMHGLSGSGKSVLAQALLEALGAIRIRSDVERKRLHGFDPSARTQAAVGGGMYGTAGDADTYTHLARLAAGLVRAGWTVLVDATFLRRADRDAFRALAQAAGCRFLVVACEAPADILRARVAARAAEGRDPSEAGREVLERQLATIEPLAPAEAVDTVVVNTGGPAANDAAVLAQIARRISPDLR
jgi:aminoglycoside phosphotransferase family enzyme/predicted kinase